MPFEFSTKPQTVKSLPRDTDQFVKEADELVESITGSWSKVKEYHYKLKDGSKESVTTYHTKIAKEQWVARISKHDGSKYPFERIVKYILGTERDEATGTYSVSDLSLHTKYEEEYIEVLNKWKQIPLESYPEYSELTDRSHLQNWYSVVAEYELGAPLKTRQFDEFILVQPPTATTPTKALVVSLVANDKPDPVTHNVRGVYASIERLELLESGEWEWRMCTCSDAGGNVPKFIQNAMISKSVAVDVPNYLNWFQEKEK